MSDEKFTEEGAKAGLKTFEDRAFELEKELDALRDEFDRANDNNRVRDQVRLSLKIAEAAKTLVTIYNYLAQFDEKYKGKI